jgi:hypothetical protein
MPLTTSIQQCNLFEVVQTSEQGHAPQPLPNNTKVTLALSGATGSSWIWHDGLVYVVLLGSTGGSNVSGGSNDAPVSLTVSNQVREGTEFAITQGDNTTLHRQMFTAFLSHGAASAGSSYAYVVLAAPTAVEAPVRVAELLAAVTVVSNAKVCAPSL